MGEVLIVVTLVIYFKALYDRKEFHEVFTLAFRQDLLRNGDKAQRMIKMCLFFAKPVFLQFYLLCGVQHCDEILYYIGNTALSVAWIYRSGERWALDGHPLLKVVKYLPYQSFFLWFVITDGYLALAMRTNTAHDLPQLYASVDVTPLIW